MYYWKCAFSWLSDIFNKQLQSSFWESQGSLCTWEMESKLLLNVIYSPNIALWVPQKKLLLTSVVKYACVHTLTHTCTHTHIFIHTIMPIDSPPPPPACRHAPGKSLAKGFPHSPTWSIQKWRCGGGAFSTHLNSLLISLGTHLDELITLTFLLKERCLEIP